MQERAVLRHDYEIVDGTGAAIGIVTSGTMSPSMNKGIDWLCYCRNSAVDSDIYCIKMTFLPKSEKTVSSRNKVILIFYPLIWRF
jgi:hypothetical protein